MYIYTSVHVIPPVPARARVPARGPARGSARDTAWTCAAAAAKGPGRALPGAPASLSIGALPFAHRPSRGGGGGRSVGKPSALAEMAGAGMCASTIGTRVECHNAHHTVWYTLLCDCATITSVQKYYIYIYIYTYTYNM